MIINVNQQKMPISLNCRKMHHCSHFSKGMDLFAINDNNVTSREDTASNWPESLKMSVFILLLDFLALQPIIQIKLQQEAGKGYTFTPTGLTKMTPYPWSAHAPCIGIYPQIGSWIYDPVWNLMVYVLKPVVGLANSLILSKITEGL